MTNEELLAKIKAEIERLKSIEYPCDNSQQATGFFNALDRMTDFINTLEEEKPIDGLEDEIQNMLEQYAKFTDGRLVMMKPSGLEKIARHFAQWGKEHAKIDVTDFCKPIDPGIAQCIADHSWEMLGEDEKPVPNDLEEAAWKYAPDMPSYNIGGGYLPPQSRYDLRTAFKDGAKWDRSQMLKEAVECETVCIKDRLLAVLPMKEFQWTVGDKVKIIIVKENEK